MATQVVAIASCRSRAPSPLPVEEAGLLAGCGLLRLRPCFLCLDPVDGNADHGLEEVRDTLSGHGRALKVRSRLDRLSSGLTLRQISSDLLSSVRGRNYVVLTYLANGGGR